MKEEKTKTEVETLLQMLTKMGKKDREVTVTTRM